MTPQAENQGTARGPAAEGCDRRCVYWQAPVFQHFCSDRGAAPGSLHPMDAQPTMESTWFRSRRSHPPGARLSSLSLHLTLALTLTWLCTILSGWAWTPSRRGRAAGSAAHTNGLELDAAVIQARAFASKLMCTCTAFARSAIIRRPSHEGAGAVCTKGRWGDMAVFRQARTKPGLTRGCMALQDRSLPTPLGPICTQQFPASGLPGSASANSARWTE